MEVGKGSGVSKFVFKAESIIYIYRRNEQKTTLDPLGSQGAPPQIEEIWFHFRCNLIALFFSFSAALFPQASEKAKKKKQNELEAKAG